MKYFKVIATIAWILLLGSCATKDNTVEQPKEASKPSTTIDDRYVPKPYIELKHPEWSKNATIYEVNIRQFTPEGTFKAFVPHLPRLKAMGIDIIWLMPIHPIGEKNRKGKMGSYCSVKDYYGVNPEFGTLEEFKSLVNTIHQMGMYVIIDWVANHSAWDNPLTVEHPEWYTKTKEGNFQPTPWYDWDDIIDFDYDQPGLHQYMTEVLKYWVKEANIDGYRCDEVISASHNFIWSIRGNGILEFRFKNIMLPDSNTNEPLSHGFARYRIKPKGNLVQGNKMTNIAYIIFDSNIPVITNFTSTTVLNPVSTAEWTERSAELLIFQNPANDVLHIEIKNNTTTFIHIQLFNAAGSLVETIENRKHSGYYKKQTVLSQFPKGLYFLTLTTDQTFTARKILIE